MSVASSVRSAAPASVHSEKAASVASIKSASAKSSVRDQPKSFTQNYYSYFDCKGVNAPRAEQMASHHVAQQDRIVQERIQRTAQQVLDGSFQASKARTVNKRVPPTVSGASKVLPS